jgi:hypothetical protein
MLPQRGAAQIHSALTDQGELALERFGEGTKEGMVSFAYPRLESALADGYGGEGAEDESRPRDRRAAIARAVEQERSRLVRSGGGDDRPQTAWTRDQAPNGHADHSHRPSSMALARTPAP